MKKNMSGFDRTIRVLIAVAIAVLYFANVISGTLAAILLIVAAIFIITGFAGVCPCYSACHISTRHEHKGNAV